MSEKTKEIVGNIKKSRNKGLHVKKFPSNYTVIDIETTGFAPGKAKILEIAAIKYKGNNIVATFSDLVKVNYIPAFIKNLTGINNKMVKDAHTIDNIIKKFYDFVGKDILMGYNVNFDINFLYDNLFDITGIELKNNYIDIMIIAKIVLKDLGKYTQENVAKHYNINIDKSHRALDDCKTCAMIFENLKKDIIQKYGSLENFYKKINNL